MGALYHIRKHRLALPGRECGAETRTLQCRTVRPLEIQRRSSGRCGRVCQPPPLCFYLWMFTVKVAVAVWSFGPVSATVIVVVPVLFVGGAPLQPAAKVATVSGSIIAKANCNPPRWLVEFLRRHRPANSSNSQPSTGTRVVFIAHAKRIGPPPNQVPIAAPDLLTRALPSASSLTASIVVTGPPCGVSERGSNSHEWI